MALRLSIVATKRQSLKLAFYLVVLLYSHTQLRLTGSRVSCRAIIDKHNHDNQY
ncbi:hypothetical protein Sps_00578 [Shewanella psychrophila]|uniref:Uncharacterized protein n=1 Tax=Shewanella psychrophila TaxID=225848 RepID=A0A1S6HJS2_9GAMM|nr:hypothetical protein Sps_00578 [Shewanella psychrophila]